MPYKYSSETANIKESNNSACFTDYIEKEVVAFRWVFPSISDARNFAPLAKDPQCSSARRKCSGWALSFHETEEASSEAWRYHINNRPNHYKKLGTHIASGTILKSDGKCSSSDEHLHFNMIEYRGAKLSTRFQHIKQLASDEMINSL
jgi:hypothetical protein